MGAVQAVELLLALTAAAIQFTEQAQKISLLLKKAQDEERALTDADWKVLFNDDDLARLKLIAQIEKMK